MANGSFAPIYTSIKRRLLDDHDKVGYIILDVLAQHCDPFGWAYPGIQRLAEISRYAPSTVATALDRFAANGWIRIHETWNDRRRQWERDYQVSPDVIWIQDEYLQHAWEKWYNPAYILPSVEQVKYSLTQVVQPATEPDTVTTEKPTTSNQLKNHHHHHTDALNEGADALKLPEPPAAHNANGNGNNNGNNAAKQPSGKDSRQAKTETEEFPPGSAAPPQYKALDQMQTPLASIEMETLSQLITSEFGTRVPQARQIVDCHGVMRTRAAMEFVREERRKKRPVKSPVGLMRWWLENCITDEQALDVVKNGVPGADTSNQYAGLTWSDLAESGD